MSFMLFVIRKVSSAFGLLGQVVYQFSFSMTRNGFCCFLFCMNNLLIYICLSSFKIMNWIQS